MYKTTVSTIYILLYSTICNMLYTSCITTVYRYVLLCVSILYTFTQRVEEKQSIRNNRTSTHTAEYCCTTVNTRRHKKRRKSPHLSARSSRLDTTAEGAVWYCVRSGAAADEIYVILILKN
jgi:hypothetical protein